MGILPSHTQRGRYYLSQRRETEVQGNCNFSCFAFSSPSLRRCTRPISFSKRTALFHFVLCLLFISITHPEPGPPLDSEAPGAFPSGEILGGLHLHMGEAEAEEAPRTGLGSGPSTQAQRGGLKLLLMHMCVRSTLSARRPGPWCGPAWTECGGWSWSQFQDPLWGTQ